MIKNIEKLSEKHSDLPFALKLCAYRRSLLLQGIDSSKYQEVKNDLKRKGESIIDALKDYQELIDPLSYRRMAFQEYSSDPLGKIGKFTEESIKATKL